ncbi:MAG: class I SAM-dependent methyltransferase [Chloroflexota bacterium]
MATVRRIPLPQEPIAELQAVLEYDKGARCYIMPEYKYFVRKILNRGIRGGRVLDIGTGSGRLAIELAKRKSCDFEIIALDISENMVRQARANARQAGVDKKIKFMVGTAAALPFPAGSFDLVMSYASLHHWFEPVAVFNEIGRVVKEAGTYIIRDNKRLYHNPLWKPVIWLMSRFMNKRHRENWPKAIMASYTVPEIREILDQSELKKWCVKSDFVGVDLSIESR